MNKTTPLIEQELDIETVLREEFDENDLWENETLKKQLVGIKQQLIEGEQQTNGHLSQEDFYGNVCKNCE